MKKIKWNQAKLRKFGVPAYVEIVDAINSSIREAQEQMITEMDKWCDERRNAPDFTTLGMVQEKLRECRAA